MPEGITLASAKTSARYRVASTTVASDWTRIERLSSTLSQFPKENMRSNGRHTDPDIVRAFGTDMPPSSDVLLHYFKGWDKGQGTPVLLVHGTIVDATSSWVKPHGEPGLAPWLAQRGYRVFAVTFAHRHGDNMLWAEQVANAIARIREVTGVKQVDVVAHSKGTVAVRALTSGVRPSWATPYQGDIRRMILIGSPTLGLDTTFRHSIINYGLYPEKDDSHFNAPMAWTRMLVMGMWVDTSAQTMMRSYGDYFPGQAQMLAHWDKEYPLPQAEQDWYTTYYGGQGFVSYSPGIDKAIADGGHFIDTLRSHPVDSNVQLAVLAGDRPDLFGIHNEHTGPSDGVVFVKSATETDDLVRGGAKLLDKKVMSLNHMDLIIKPEAHAWVDGILRQP
ncbi:MAG TPA: hypothetical protein V6D05_00620 [Stenomitos sp.]